MAIGHAHGAHSIACWLTVRGHHSVAHVLLPEIGKNRKQLGHVIEHTNGDSDGVHHFESMSLELG